MGFLRTTIIAVTILMGGPGVAQTVGDYDRAMQAVSEAEDYLLDLQESFQEQAEDLPDPIWVINETGVHIVDGDYLQEQVEAMVFVGQVMGLEDFALGQMSPLSRMIAEMVPEGERPRIAANHIMNRIRAISFENRALVSRQLEEQLEQVRARFNDLRAARDELMNGSAAAATQTGGSGNGGAGEAPWANWGNRPVDPANGDAPCDAFENTAGPHGARNLCLSLGFGGAEWSGGPLGQWECSGSGQPVDFNAVCSAIYGGRSVGFCHVGAPGEDYWRYNTMCVLTQ